MVETFGSDMTQQWSTQETRKISHNGRIVRKFEKNVVSTFVLNVQV